MALQVTKKKVCRFVLILALLACFAVQVKNVLVKFVKGQTTIAATTEFLNEAELPVLSFCPGYKHDYFSEQMNNLITLTEKSK